MASLSTHVLDTSLGRPAAGIRVALESASGATVGEGVTDEELAEIIQQGRDRRAIEADPSEPGAPDEL